MVKTEKHGRQEAIQKATHLFWKKGFHATSMRNLQEVIDMRPGSIYANFGSKEGLFKETLLCYAEASLARLAACSEVSSPLSALQMFIQGSVVGSHESSPSDICMLVKTVAELTEDNADLLAEARRLLSNVEDAFTTLLTQAQARGELDESRDPRRLARFLQMQVMGLRVYVRASGSNAPVNELIEDAFTSLR